MNRVLKISLYAIGVIAVIVAAAVYFLLKPSPGIGESLDPAATLSSAVDSVLYNGKSAQDLDTIAVSGEQTLLGKMKDAMTSAVVDTLMTKVAKVSNVDDLTVYDVKSKNTPFNIIGCVLDGKVLTISFETKEPTNNFGIIRGEVSVNGRPVQWVGRNGLLAGITGSARLRDSSSSVRPGAPASLESAFGAYSGQKSVLLPDDFKLQAAVGVGPQGKCFLVQAPQMVTAPEMYNALVKSGAVYAVFIVGHLAYDINIDSESPRIVFASYESAPPSGLPLRMW